MQCPGQFITEFVLNKFLILLFLSVVRKHHQTIYPVCGRRESYYQPCKSCSGYLHQQGRNLCSVEYSCAYQMVKSYVQQREGESGGRERGERELVVYGKV